MNPNIPTPFLQFAKDRERVLEWWNGLHENQRQSLVHSYEAESYPKNFVVYRDSNSEEQVDTVVEGVFVDDRYEYLVNHELFTKPVRTFHVCTAHPVARAVQIKGILPSDFICPLSQAEAQCPMRQILAQAPGQAFILTDKSNRKP